MFGVEQCPNLSHYILTVITIRAMPLNPCMNVKNERERYREYLNWFEMCGVEIINGRDIE